MGYWFRQRFKCLIARVERGTISCVFSRQWIFPMRMRTTTPCSMFLFCFSFCGDWGSGGDDCGGDCDQNSGGGVVWWLFTAPLKQYTPYLGIDLIVTVTTFTTVPQAMHSHTTVSHHSVTMPLVTPQSPQRHSHTANSHTSHQSWGVRGGKGLQSMKETTAFPIPNPHVHHHTHTPQIQKSF